MVPAHFVKHILGLQHVVDDIEDLKAMRSQLDDRTILLFIQIKLFYETVRLFVNHQFLQVHDVKVYNILFHVCIELWKLIVFIFFN